MREMEKAREEIQSYLDNLFTNKQTNGRTLLVPKVAIATEKQHNANDKEVDEQ